ncbi:unnamed protein product, partial [Rotaria sordida]
MNGRMTHQMKDSDISYEWQNDSSNARHNDKFYFL